MAIDFSLSASQRKFQLECRAFAQAELGGVAAAVRDLPTPAARFQATRPMYEAVVREGFLRRLIPQPFGGEGTGLIDMAILTEEFYAVDANVSLTLLATLLGRYFWPAARRSSRSCLPPSSPPPAPRWPHSPIVNPAAVPTTRRPRRRWACAPRRDWTATNGSSTATKNG